MKLFFQNMKCPVCKKTKLQDKYDICTVCGWENDPVQRKDANFAGGANQMSLNEARAAYKAGQPVK